MAENREESIRLVDEARAVFTDWQESNRACDRLKDEIIKQEMELTREKSSLEERADAEIRRKRLELEDRFDRQAEKLANERKRVLANRDKAKKRGVKERVTAETADQRRDIDIQTKAAADLFRNNKVPGFCNSSLFYTLFSPRRLTEVLGAIIFFLICFGAIPLAIYYFLMNHTYFYLAIVYAADIFVFGGIYILIRRATISKHADVIKEGRLLRNKIHSAKKQIRKTGKQIRKDKDESHYDLGDFDMQLTRLSEENTKLLADKRQALVIFDTETVESIRQQFAADNQERFQRMEEALAAARAEEEKQRGIAAAASAELDSRFVPILGEELISQEALGDLRRALEEGAWDIESARRAILGSDAVPFGEITDSQEAFDQAKGSEAGASFDQAEGAEAGEAFDQAKGSEAGESIDQAEGSEAGEAFDQAKGSEAGEAFDQAEGSEAGASFHQAEGSEAGASFDQPEAAGGVEDFSQPQGLSEDESFDQAEVDTMDDVIPMDQPEADPAQGPADDDQPFA